MGQLGGGGAWPIAAGTMLGKYQIVRLVGEGGMGAVYEGLHAEIGKRVAIKVMSPALAAIPEARARFVREAQVTSRIRHAHIIDVTDIGCEAGHPFMVMEYLEGEDLAKHICRRGPFAIEEVADIALPLLAAVGAAHAEGIVHRDLKPQNVFLAEMHDGSLRPMVLDFGISKAPPQLAADPINTAGGLIGSPSYFAPEQVNDPKGADARSDQYALGVILYECVAGRLPYEGSNLASIFQAILRGHYFPARRHRPDLPDGFGAVIARAMSIDPCARFTDLREMGRALLPFASEKARVVWTDQFESDRARPGAAAAPARVRMPVTDQMPPPAHAPRAVTASLAAKEPAPARERGPESSDVSLYIPRLGRRMWVLGGVALATALLAAAALHVRGRPSVAAIRSAAAATPGRQAGLAAIAPPVPGTRAAAPRATSGDDEDTKRTAAPRRGRLVRRLRFGPNRAPLIE
ncbi:MAG TPA: serine/threonine-protein kinase [Polyangia bacterium]|nr:serine/threonine-protein kinase [Polyangia bacterium]